MTHEFVHRVYNGLFRHDEWNVGIVSEPIDSFLRSHVAPRINWLPPIGRGRFLADPFGVIKDGRVYLLCEEFDYSTQKGRIVGTELARGGPCSALKVAIELPVSVSYPYLIRDGDEVYCVPETHQAGEIVLYRAEELPHRWTKVTTLVSDFPGIDSTIFEYEGSWWLLCTTLEAPLSRLFVWHAPALLGPWRPHKRNPVKVDIGSSRPAGTPFIHDGALFRPAQDCSRTYGGRIVLNRVRKLSPEEFEEELAAIVEPVRSGAYPDGLHTLSAVGNTTLIDGKRLRFIRSAFKNALVKGFKMISHRSDDRPYQEQLSS